MKIAVATMKGGLDDTVSPVFGRCANFTIVEVEGEEIKASEIVENQFAGAMGGVGIQAAQLVANEGVEVAIAGNFGPNAFGILNQAEIKIVQAQGTVREVVMKYIKGDLKPADSATAPMFGGSGMGRGAGRGFGRGGGAGRGRF